MATPSLLRRVIESHGQDTEILSIKDRVLSNTSDEGWAIHTDGSLQYKGRVVVLQSADMREEILKEFHCSRFAVHLGGTKMYHDICHQYYWSGMKKHVEDFVTHFPQTSREHDAVWVIVDRLTKLAHFLAVHMTFNSAGCTYGEIV